MKPFLLVAALLSFSGVCIADTTVRPLGGYVEQFGEMWVLLEIRSTESVASIDGTFLYSPGRLFLSASAAGNVIEVLGGNATATVDLDPDVPNRVGFSIRILNGNSICCPGRFSHFLSMRFSVIPIAPFEIGIAFDDAIRAREVRNVAGEVVPTTWAFSHIHLIPAQWGSTLSVASTHVPSGQTRTVPIFLKARGEETHIAFSLLHDPTRVTIEEIALGADAANGTLITSPVAGWRTGVIIIPINGLPLAAGNRHLLNIKVRSPDGASEGITRFWFSDDPIFRDLSGAAGNSLPLFFGIHQITVGAGLEGDVSPRPEGNGVTTLVDFTQLGRFVMGLDAVTNGPEFMKADCAPRESRGDGQISLADYVQAGRYAVQLDEVGLAGGPAAPTSLTPESDTHSASLARPVVRPRSIQLTQVPSRKGLTYALEIDGYGDENAVSFSIDIEGMRLISAEPADPGAAVHLNETVAGRIGVMLAMPPGLGFSRRMMTFRFEGKGEAKFADGPVQKELVDVGARDIPVSFQRQ